MQLSLTRLGLLLWKQWVENRKLYVLGMLALVGIMAGVCFFNSEGLGLRTTTQEAIFIGGLFTSSSIFSITTLSRYNNKTSSIQELMLPALALEKTIAAVLCSMVLYPLLYVLIIYPLLAVVNYVNSELFGHYNLLYELRDLWKPGYVCLYLLLQSGILLCSVLFRQYVLIKSALVFCIFVFGTNYLNDKMAKGIIAHKQPAQLPAQYHELLQPWDFGMGEIYADERPFFTIIGPNPFQSFELSTPRRRWIVEPSVSQRFWFMLLYFSAVPFLWVIIWFRLREKQL